MSSSRTESLVDVTMPQMGVSVAEGTVVQWRVETGDRIEADATICEISTDKIDTEVPAPVSGVVAEILVPVDATVSVGVVLARIASGSGDAVRNGGPAADSSPLTAPAPTQGRDREDGVAEAHADAGEAAGAAGPVTRDRGRRYSPVVKRVAAEHGLDLSRIAGTGRDGRVRKQDVLAFLEASPEPPLHTESPYRPEPVVATEPAGASAGAAGAAAGSAGALGGLSRIRRQIGEHMKRSLDTAAHCTTWIEVDMSRIEAARAQLGMTALPFVARAAILALREHPSLNAWLEDQRYTPHHEVNLGIAVSLGEDGLIVPVVHGAHELSVEGLAARIKDLARRARARELTPDDVRGERSRSPIPASTARSWPRRSSTSRRSRFWTSRPSSSTRSLSRTPTATTRSRFAPLRSLA